MCLNLMIITFDWHVSQPDDWHVSQADDHYV